MIGVFISVALAATPLSGSAEVLVACEPPPTRDVSALQAFAQRSGELSVGLDSVATWCFGSSGEWQAGEKPVGDCARALKSCQAATASVTKVMKSLLVEALADLERPFAGKSYVPKRSGLAERPSETVDCLSKNRAVLFAQAQARMDVARLASQAHAEYANYKTWLFAEGLKCAQAERGATDATRKATTIDARSPPSEAPRSPPREAPRSSRAESRDAAATPPSEAALSPRAESRDGGASLAEKWAAFAAARARFELDPDYTLGFLASRELRDCRCQRPNPAALSRRTPQNENAQPLDADDQKNTQCEVCLQSAFAAWKTRSQKQCALLDTLSDYELGVIDRSDDGNGIPPRCFEAVWRKRDGGVPPRPRPAVAQSDTGAPSTFDQRAPAREAATQGPPPAPPVLAQGADAFVRAQDWAPIPLREDGRLYVRLFMSSACSAEVLPGPMVARTGDLLLIPLDARQLTVRSPCGGLAEVYWGREMKPRVSEVFARNQPLHLQFKPQ